MYCEFYQLTEPPFNVTPDPKFLYLNARYREAIASLNYGITQRKGFITLIGEAGTGKTTLLNKLLEELDPKTKSVFIFNTNVNFEEILEYMFAEFALPIHNGKKLYMLQRLNSFLLEELRGGGNVALLIDESQDLEFSVLEDLRLLSNLETAKEKILQIVLSGQPELGQKLSNPILRQLRQRIGINCRLLPLSRDEISEYIQYRLQAAGCPDLKLFSRDAEEQIYRFSRGVPRLVNVVCDNAMVIGYALGKKRIGGDVITEAAADLLSVEPPQQAPGEGAVEVAALPPPLEPKRRWRARFGVVSLVVAATLVGLLSVGRTVLHRRGDNDNNVTPTLERPHLEVIRPGAEPESVGVEVPLAREHRAAAGAAAPARRPVTNLAAAAGGKRAAGEAVAMRPLTVPAQGALASKPSAHQQAAAPQALPNPQLGRPARREAAPPPVPALAPQVPASHEVRPPGGGGAPVEGSVRVVRGAERPPAPPPVALPKVSEATQPMPGLAPLAKKDEEVNPPVAEQPVPQLARAGQHTTHIPPARKPPRKAETTQATGGERLPRIDGVKFSRIVVQSGDSMSAIAFRKYGQASYTILDLLKLANPDLEDIDLIAVGQRIRLPELGDSFPILDHGSGHYALLVFSTPLRRRAARLQQALQSRGFDAHVSAGSVGSNKPMFRVVLSGFTDRGAVVKAGKRLQKLFRQETRFAQLGG
ncbi:MAG: AAA family ATPase [Candidatus Binatia bacterium]